jgi:hypothetical protein
MLFNRRAGTRAALFLLFVSCIATSDAALLSFGTRQLQVPAPAGFEAVAKRAPQSIEAIRTYTPDNIRTVELYTTSQVAAQLARGRQTPLGRYFVLQVDHSDEGKSFSFDRFSGSTEQLEAALKSQLQLDHIGDNKYVAKAIAQHGVSATANPALQASSEFLGLTRKEPWGLFFAIKFHDKDGSETIMDNAIVAINYQLMSLTVYAPYHGPQDRAWADFALLDWANALRGANPDDPVIGASVPKRWTPDDFGRIGRDIGWFVGILVALLLGGPRLRARKK